MPTQTQAAPQGQKISPQQANAMARNYLLAKAVPRLISVYSSTINPVTTPTLNIPPSYTGLIRRFLIIVSGSVTNNSTTNALNITQLGFSNLFQNQGGVIFQDLQNYQRVNTNGWHLNALASVKHRKPWASGYALETDEVMAFGENFPIITTPSTVAANGATANFRMVFELPIAYGPRDLRGAIYANVVNATANLQLNFNTNNFAAGTGQDATFAVFSTADATANVTLNYSVEVYQDFLDQLPVGQSGGVVLPQLDVSKMYRLETTFLPNITANIDNPLNYANFRKFISTIALYDNGGTLNGGSDIAYWSIKLANYLDYFRVDPYTQAMHTREVVGTDLPKGMYYFSHRDNPIETTQSGNTALNLQPLTANAGATMYVGYENFSTPQLLSQAGSLAA